MRRKQRRDLLPIWIKVFIWIFLILSIISVIGFVIRLLGVAFPIEIFGISSNDPLSQKGVIITALFLFKGIVAYSLWREEKDAIDIAILDAIVSLFICIGQSLYSFLANETHIRLELIIIIPYFIKLYQIRKEWKLLT